MRLLVTGSPATDPPGSDDAGRLLRALVVEDLATDAELMMFRLEQEGLAFDWTRVQTEHDYLAALSTVPHIILADWHLPQFSGERALALLRDSELDIPFVIVSGGIGEEAAIDALQQGASDYALKDRPARLGTAVRRALEARRLRDERRATESRLRQAARVFDSTSEGVVLTDLNARIVAVNRAFTEITGYHEDEVLGQNPRMMQSGRHDVVFYREMWRSLQTKGEWRGEIWNRRKNGDVYPEWLTLSTVRNEAGEPVQYVAIFSDISLIKETQSQVDFLGHHDALTRLPNRLLLRDRCAHAIARAQRTGGSLAVLMLDLDRFKNVNETLGHSAGDELLLELAGRLRQATRGGDTLARLGGDGFVFLLEGQVDAQSAVVTAQDVLRRVSQPMRVGGHELVMTASIGISLYPGDGEDVDTLLMHADRALYEAKSRGRNTYQFFEPALAAGVFERLLLENALRNALSRNELTLHYQPQIDLRSGKMVSVEALARWRHPELGLVPPSQFIPLAEEIGIIDELGRWVLYEASRQMIDWQAQGLDVPRVAVNLSMKQVIPELVDQVAAILRHTGLPANRLELEVTESAIMRHPEQVLTVLQDLVDRGVQVAVDDFGTGYSSLAYVKRLSMHRLKIDQSFVSDIGRDVRSEAIIRAIIAMARCLGLETVAEGVEREHQVEFLKQEACDIAQGRLFSYPLSASDLLSARGPSAARG